MQPLMTDEGPSGRGWKRWLVLGMILVAMLLPLLSAILAALR